MSFSGAVKIADGFDDFLAPSQSCIKPLIDAAAQKGDEGKVKVCSMHKAKKKKKEKKKYLTVLKYETTT